jgi:phosphatidylglycerophosphate synthase
MRLLAGIVLLISTIYFFNKVLIAVVFSIGFISDIFDGIIARKMKISTEALRRLDSTIDTIFYLCAFVGLYLHFWNVVQSGIAWVIIIIGLKIIRYVYDYIKFRKETAYHMYSAKIWNVLLFLFFLELLFNDRLGIFFTLVIIVGIVTNIESLLTSILLRNWEHDLPSVITLLNRKDKHSGSVAK